MATAKTLLTMVKYFEESSANAGIKPQEVRVKAKRLSDKTGLTWETVSNALKEPELGFNKDSDGYWSLGVNYVWRDVVKTFESGLPEAAKMSMWRTYPQISSAPVGIKPDSSEVEVKRCNKPHYDKWVTDTIDKCLTAKFNESVDNVLNNDRGNLLAQAIKDNNLEVAPIVVQYGLAMVKKANA